MIRYGRNIFIFMVAVVISAGALYMQPTGNRSTGGHGHGHGAGEQHEHGGIELSDEKVAAAGIELATAGPTVLNEFLWLNGILQPNQEALVQVTPRFPGIVRAVYKRVGDRVAKGETLATIESNQSLTIYELKASIDGTVIERQLSLGEYASEQKPAFVVADLSTVWIDFPVYRSDLKRVQVGDKVAIDLGDGSSPIETEISYIAPVGAVDTQSALARAVAPNAGMRLRPGLFVTGKVLMRPKDVELAVKRTALQTVENRTVIFVRSGQKFEIRDVEVGDRDPVSVEILFGLVEGDVYAANNSFVVKAELAKATATHEH